MSDNRSHFGFWIQGIFTSKFEQGVFGYCDIVIDCCLNLLNILNIVEYCGIRGRNYHGWVIIDAVWAYVGAGTISISVLILRI